jgi:hypothetical protein
LKCGGAISPRQRRAEGQQRAIVYIDIYHRKLLQSREGHPEKARLKMGGDGPSILTENEGRKFRMVGGDGTEITKISDQDAPRNEYLFPSPAAFLVKETRDFPMGHLQFNITVTVIPCAIALFTCNVPAWLGLLYDVALVAIFFQRFVLCLHYSEHRKIFKKEYGILNAYLQFVVAPFMGIPTGMYHLHHVVMHHKENNVFPWDLSSTEPYQRDSVLHFLHYLFRFMFAAWIELPYYALKRNKPMLAARALATSVSYWTTLYVLWKGMRF